MYGKQTENLTRSIMWNLMVAKQVAEAAVKVYIGSVPHL